MSDLAIRGGPVHLSSREWIPASSPTSLDTDPRLSSLDVRRQALHPERVLTVRAAGRRWIAGVNDQLLALSLLDEDWDTYGSPPPTAKALGVTRALLTNVQGLDVPVPRVRGTSAGGVTIEWFTAAVELILEIEPDGVVTVFVRNGATGIASEGRLEDEVEVVVDALGSLRLGL